MSVAQANKTPGPFSGWTELPRKIVVMELVERLVVLSLFLYFLNNILGKGAAAINVASVLIVLSETLPILFVMSRGPSESLSMRPSDWLFGIAGAAAPLLAIAPATQPLVPAIVCVLMMMSASPSRSAASSSSAAASASSLPTAASRHRAPIASCAIRSMRATR